MTVVLLVVGLVALGAIWWRALDRAEDDEQRRHDRWLYEHARSQPREEWDR